MNPQSTTTSNSPDGALTSTPVASVPVTSSAADRLYQLAALTAGIFLLATML